MKIPNDLPADAAVYYREYVEAGGTTHAAKAYAVACHERDKYGARMDGYTQTLTSDEGDAVNVQVMWAVQKAWDAASKTAEKLRDALPKAAPKADTGKGFFAK